MKHQKLALADKFFTDIRQGTKTRTLRFNEPIITEGFLLFFGSEDPTLTDIVYVHNVNFGEAEIMAPLYNMSSEELLIGMRDHYKDVPEDAQFMLIEHLSPSDSKNIKSYKSFKTLCETS